MMMEFNLHGEAHAVATRAQLQTLLARSHTLAQCELWLTMASDADADADQGPALCMLRNGGNAWLMYWSPQDGASYHSLGDEEAPGECSYLLANGQVDFYPEAWCIAVELCHQAMAAFLRDRGMRPAAVAWQAD